jgi:alanine dehydrogenase
LTNATLPFVTVLDDKGWQQALADDLHFAAGLNVHDSQVTYAAVAEVLALKVLPLPIC